MGKVYFIRWIIMERNHIVYTEPDSTYSGNCAFCTAMQYAGIDVTFSEMVALKPFLIPSRAESILKQWAVQKIKVFPVKSPSQMDSYLAKWFKIVCFSQIDKSKSNMYPYEISLRSGDKRFFVITEDLWDRWKAQFSLWVWFWDSWFVYIKKDQYKYMFTPKRITKF